MPKATPGKIVETVNGMETVEMETARGGEDKGKVTIRFTRPVLSHFKDFVASLSDEKPYKAGESETELQHAHRAYVTALERMARAAVYQSIAAESTVISVGREKINIMDFPLARLVKAINSTRNKRADDLAMLGIDDPEDPENEKQVSAVDRKINYNQFETAARKLVADGKAKENEETGFLVAA